MNFLEIDELHSVLYYTITAQHIKRYKEKILANFIDEEKFDNRKNSIFIYGDDRFIFRYCYYPSEKQHL